jgi:CDP-glucose 4,6-dehydratase
MGAKVIGVSIDVPCEPSNFEAANLSDLIDDRRIDIRDLENVKSIIEETQPDFIFHLAAQSLVRKSYSDPLDTFSTNALGSATILQALRDYKKPIVVVMITSDKAYDNVEWPWGYRETDRLGGKDPYSASKGMAEIAIRSFIESYFMDSESNVRIGITRAGNVIGGGDWAKDRIVPDCMKSWSKNIPVEIRSPKSTRPWQHVLEPLSGYLRLGVSLFESQKLHGEAYNFGPTTDQNFSVSELINEMSEFWDNVSWNDVSGKNDNLHEAGLLKLNCDKALADLNWISTLEFEDTVRMTVSWYKDYYQGAEDQSMYEFTVEQINEYMQLAEKKGIEWSI